MKRYIVPFLVVFLSAIALCASDTKAPRLTAVEPDTVKVGDVATTKGENLEKAVVAELFLTDGKNDTKVTITEQSGEMLKFQIPKIKVGRYRLMTGSKTSMIEQPVVVEVQ